MGPDDRSARISAAGDAARASLEPKHRARETGLSASRRAIQASARAIRAVHRGEFEGARGLVAEAKAYVAEADAALVDHGDIRYAGFLHDAKKEYAEAELTLAFVAHEPVPGADDLGVETAAYLNGMAEAASELRRQALDRLRLDDLAEAESLLAVMDDVYGVLVTIDYPDAMTGGLRRSTDALRAVIERTRGDVTNAQVASRVRDAMNGSRGSAL